VGAVPKTMEDRRRFARLDIALSVSYVVRDSSGQVSEMAEAKSTDISASGIRLMTPSPHKNGDTLDLEISIEREEGLPIKAVAEVVWQNKLSETSYEIGAVIRHMEDSDKKRLMDFVFDQLAQMMGLESNNKRH
jgi:c-di-GMP-binding flagellar brake protein YcgR